MQCVNTDKLRGGGNVRCGQIIIFFILAKQLCEYLASSPALREKRAWYAPSTYAPDLLSRGDYDVSTYTSGLYQHNDVIVSG